MTPPNPAAVCLLLLASTSVSHANWPAWRGPQANAVAPQGDYPAAFGPGVNQLWQVDLPGQGASTPVVWDDAIFLTAEVDGLNALLCYGLDGQPRWRRDLGQATPAKHRNATGSNPSAVVDAGHVVAYFKSGTVACFTRQGKELWRTNLQEKYGPDTLWWDLGTSPVLTSAGVAIAVMQDAGSYLITLDLNSGDVVWKQQRQFPGLSQECGQSYATPAVFNLDGSETIVTWGADHLTGHNAQTGELMWECGGFNPDNNDFWRVIASATIANGVAYVPYGRGGFVTAVKLGGSGDITNTGARLWTAQQVGSDVPCPVVYDDKVYILGDKGQVSCLDASTGDALWSSRLPRGRGQYYSSPLLANGLLYCVREDGVAFVASIEEGLELIATNDLGDDTVATPVPVEDSLLLRTRTKLFRFGQQ